MIRKITRLGLRRSTLFYASMACSVALLALLTYVDSSSTKYGLGSVSSISPFGKESYVSISVRSLDVDSRSIGLKIAVYIPTSRISNATWEPLEVEVITVLPEYFHHQNLSLDRSAPYYFGFADYTVSVESQRHLYPFDSYTTQILLRIPKWIKEKPKVVGSISSELGPFYVIANAEVSGSHGISGDGNGASRARSSSTISPFFSIRRPIAQRILILLPFWAIFLVLFIIVGKLDATIADHFRGKMSLYAGLFVFTLGYAIVNAPLLCIISDVMKFCLVTTLASFIIFDIIQFANKSDTIHISSVGVNLNARNMQFFTSLIVLVVLQFFLTQGFRIDGLSIGLTYVLLPIVPMILMFFCLYFLEKRLWIVVAIIEPILVTLVLFQHIYF